MGAEESSFKCIDCKASTLIGSARIVEDIHEVNQLAAALAEMPQKRLTEYKAILTATKCNEFDDAVQLLSAMEDYIVTREYATLEDAAWDEMSVIVSPDSVEIMLPYLDPEDYGRALVNELNGDLIAYGMVERKGRQPVYIPKEQAWLRDRLITMSVKERIICQQATVITDFTDLEKIGRDYIMASRGG